MSARSRKITAYSVGDTAGWELLPASPRRQWMEQTPGGFANRCLPLTIANQAGWILTCPVAFDAQWNGEEGPSSGIVFRFQSEESRYASQILSHFGSGIITFSVPYLFRTPPGLGLLVRGLPNEPKYNCSPLEGFVETDWASSTFTMNWKVQKAGIPVSFSCGEPICFLQPFELGAIERLQPGIQPIESAPKLASAYKAWRESRAQFNQASDRGTDWQKHYHRGREVNGPRARIHKTSLRLSSFTETDGGSSR